MTTQGNPLQSLLPGQTKYPAKLTNLSATLLSQSRLRAPHLKPEEEIARSHACAEIACRRLRAQLRLPPTKDGTAPCKPVVYKKLLKFLEGILGDTTTIPPTTTNATPVSKGQPPNVAGKKRKRGNEPQPVEDVRETNKRSATKKTAKDEFVGTVNTTTSNEDNRSDSPAFVTPAIRTLCRTFGTKQMMPHVYTGTCIVLGLADLWPRPNSQVGDKLDEGFEKTVKDLIIALYLMVLTRMQTGKLTTRIFKATAIKSIETLEVSSQTKDIEAWIRRINKDGFCQGQDWWESVPEGVFDFDPDRPAEEVVMDGQDGERSGGNDEDVLDSRSGTSRKLLDLNAEDPDGVLLVGLGTMMQDAVDFLSEQRTLEYLDWEQNILKRIQKSPGGRKAIAQVRVTA